MVKIEYVALVMAVCFTAAWAEVSTSRPPITNVPIGSCDTAPDGDFQPHPTDCTRYIRCTHGLAQDMPCPACNETNRCPDGFLHWNDAIDTCDWPDVADCNNGPITQNPPTASPSTASPSTDSPSTDSPSTASPSTASPSTDSPSTASPSTDSPSTASPVMTTVPTSPTPTPGDSCDPTNCTIVGTCLTYTYCQRKNLETEGPLGTTGELIKGTCGTTNKGVQLYFNPDKKANPADVTGVCDFWKNLSKTVQDQYLLEPECSVCEYTAVADCSQEYDYKHEDPSSPTGWVTDRLSCSNDLVFDVVNWTCADPCKVTLKDRRTCQTILGLTCL